jgi:hypothetical protein
VQQAVHVQLTQNQFDALVSLAYSIGCSAFLKSTLLSLLNAGALSDKEAQIYFTRWHNSCAKKGLQKQRFVESQLFSSCEKVFPCDADSCSIADMYTQCTSNCMYCEACIPCKNNAYSF